MAINREGKYKLLSFTMTTPTQPLDLSKYTSKLDLYESVLTPSVIAELVITDGTGMFSNFNFTEQTINISWTTDETGPGITYSLKVIDVKEGSPLPNNRGVVFVLTAVSQEVITAKTIKNIQLVTKDLEPENIVQKLLKQLNTKKQLLFEKTTGLFTYSILNITAFEAINQVRKSAVSSTHKGSAYVFFENRKGYVFKSIEKLIEEGLASIGDKIYISAPIAQADVTASTWRNILAMKILQAGNKNIALSIGGYSNQVKRYNLETGALEYFGLPADQVKFLTLNNGSITTSLKADNEASNQGSGQNLVNLYDPDKEKNTLAEKYNYLPYYISHLLSVILHITVYGDTSVDVGDVITCNIPEQTGLTTGQKRPYTPPSAVLSGNFFVAKCRHVLTFGEDPKYFQAFEIIKDGIGGKAPSVRLQ